MGHPRLRPHSEYGASFADEASLHARAYDLFLFLQTVPDAAVTEIMASGAMLRTDVKFVVISEGGRQQPFGCGHVHDLDFQTWPFAAESGRAAGREWPRRPSLRDEAFQ
jgi:hypothetical protein